MTNETLTIWLDHIPAILMALGTFTTAVLSALALRKSGKNATAIETVRKDVNGINAARLSEAKIASHAEGVLEEKGRGKQ